MAGSGSTAGRLELSGRVWLNGGQVTVEWEGPAKWGAGYS